MRSASGSPPATTSDPPPEPIARKNAATASTTAPAAAATAGNGMPPGDGGGSSAAGASASRLRQGAAFGSTRASSTGGRHGRGRRTVRRPATLGALPTRQDVWRDSSGALLALRLTSRQDGSRPTSISGRRMTADSCALGTPSSTYPPPPGQSANDRCQSWQECTTRGFAGSLWLGCRIRDHRKFVERDGWDVSPGRRNIAGCDELVLASGEVWDDKQRLLSVRSAHLRGSHVVRRAVSICFAEPNERRLELSTSKAQGFPSNTVFVPGGPLVGSMGWGFGVAAEAVLLAGQDKPRKRDPDCHQKPPLYRPHGYLCTATRLSRACRGVPAGQARPRLE